MLFDLNRVLRHAKRFQIVLIDLKGKGERLEELLRWPTFEMPRSRSAGRKRPICIAFES